MYTNPGCEMSTSCISQDTIKNKVELPSSAQNLQIHKFSYIQNITCIIFPQLQLVETIMQRKQNICLSFSIKYSSNVIIIIYEFQNKSRNTFVITISITITKNINNILKDHDFISSSTTMIIDHYNQYISIENFSRH